MEVLSPSLNAIIPRLPCCSTEVVGKRIIKYIDAYLQSLNAKCAVVEQKYVDRDFLEDYTRYYSRCFKSYDRSCWRVHFFTTDYSEQNICDALTSGNDDDKVRLQESYLGFVVIRPLPQTVIGRTCLRPYMEENGRNYKALCDVSVSFFGVHLTIRCMPFQEQDSTVAACATCALWSAFKVTANFFQHEVYTPGKITELATSHGLSSVRSLPNGSGLTINDVLYAIRHVGLDPVVVRAGSETLGESVILGNIYSYLGLGISVVVLGDIVNSEGKKIGGHAINVNGYHLIEKGVPRVGRSSRLRACLIDKLYVHDDQVGPYARAQIQDDGSHGRWILKYDDMPEEEMAVKIFVPQYLIIPVYQKIRVSYDEVWNCAYQFDAIINVLPDLVGMLEWDIVLCASNDVKSVVRCSNRIAAGEKLRFLTTGLPKYIWKLTLSYKGDKWAVFCIDATDAGQGLNVAASIFFSPELPEMINALHDAMPSISCMPLCNACLEVLHEGA